MLINEVHLNADNFIINLGLQIYFLVSFMDAKKCSFFKWTFKKRIYRPLSMILFYLKKTGKKLGNKNYISIKMSSKFSNSVIIIWTTKSKHFMLIGSIKCVKIVEYIFFTTKLIFDLSFFLMYI